MKTAKIYFKGKLVSIIKFETVMYVIGHEFRDNRNQLVAIVPLTHLVVINESSRFKAKEIDILNTSSNI